MKKFLKTLAVFAAVAALGFGFASCADDDDDSGSGSALVAYSLARILMVKLTPLVFTTITAMQCTCIARVLSSV